MRLVPTVDPGWLRGARGFAGAGLLGLISAAALPPLNVVPVLLLAIPGLLALIAAQPRMRGAAAIGFWFGFGHHCLGLYWINDAILIEAARLWWVLPFAVPLLAAVLALFIAVPCALAWLVPAGWRRVGVLAGLWVIGDLARQFTLTGFPWNPIGSVWAAANVVGDVMIQPAALIGVHGLTLATLLIAATPALGARALIAGIAGLGVWAGFGMWRLANPVAPADLRVVLVQGNVAEGQKHDRQFAMDTFQRYLRLTREGLDKVGDHPAVVIWPETASPFLLDRDAGARAAIAAVAGGAPVLAGSVRFDAADRPRNSLMAIVNAGPPAMVYDKSHLVPFGEYQPSWTPVPVEFVPGNGFAAGNGPQTFTVPGLPPFGALICYEAIFPAQVVDPHDRPLWLVNITNDAWFGNSSGPRQHLEAARMRAVEEGLPLARAANTGISTAFDAYGHEQGRLGLGVEGTLVVTLGGALPPTLFGRFGLTIPALLALLSCLVSLPRIRTRNTDTSIS